MLTEGWYTDGELLEELQAFLRSPDSALEESKKPGFLAKAKLVLKKLFPTPPKNLIQKKYMVPAGAPVRPAAGRRKLSPDEKMVFGVVRKVSKRRKAESMSAKQMREVLAEMNRVSRGESLPRLSEAAKLDMGTALVGKKAWNGKPIKGKTMNPENTAALEKLLWGWQKEEAKQKTYAQTFAEFMDALEKDGWTLKRSLKIPHATSPDGKHKLWFKTQAVYQSRGDQGFGDARTLTYNDLRKYDYAQFKKLAMHDTGMSKADEMHAQMAESETQVGETIAVQMAGGINKMRVMLGAKLAALPNGLRIQWPQKKRSLGNVCTVTLDPDDTYTMEFFNGAKSVKKFSGLYADDLKRTFEGHTGWYLSF